MRSVRARDQIAASGVSLLLRYHPPYDWTAMLDYRLYPAYFPFWALARHVQLISIQAKNGAK